MPTSKWSVVDQNGEALGHPLRLAAEFAANTVVVAIVVLGTWLLVRRLTGYDAYRSLVDDGILGHVILFGLIMLAAEGLRRVGLLQGMGIR